MFTKSQATTTGRFSVAASLLIGTFMAQGCATTREVDWSKTAKREASADEAAQATTLIAEGDALWAARVDQKNLAGAIAKWEQAAALAPTAELAVKLSRAHYFLGDGYHALAGNTAEQDKEYQLGLDWAEKAVALSAPEYAAAMAKGGVHATEIVKIRKEAVPAFYWHASNLGKWATSKGFTTRLKYKDDIKATMTQLQALDENYFYAGPWRYFGGFEALTAGMGGDLVKSEQNFEKSIALAPNYLATKVLYADLLCPKIKDKARYQRLLSEVLAADVKVDPELEAENTIAQAQAKKLMAIIEDKFE